MPEEYQGFFEYEIGEPVLVIGEPEEVFSILSYGVELYYSKDGEGRSFYYSIISEMTGEVERVFEDEIISFEEFEQMEEDEIEFLFNGKLLEIEFIGVNEDGSTEVKEVVNSDSEVVQEERSIDDLLDEYNSYKAISKKSEGALKDAMNEMALEIKKKLQNSIV